MFFEFFLVCFYYFCFLVDWLWCVVCTTIDSKTVAFLSGRAVALGCLVECYPLYCALSGYRWEVCCGILGREKIMRVRGCQSGSTLTEWVLLCQKGMGNFYVLQSWISIVEFSCNIRACFTCLCEVVFVTQTRCIALSANGAFLFIFIFYFFIFLPIITPGKCGNGHLDSSCFRDLEICRAISGAQSVHVEGINLRDNWMHHAYDFNYF